MGRRGTVPSVVNTQLIEAVGRRRSIDFGRHKPIGGRLDSRLREDDSAQTSRLSQLTDGVPYAYDARLHDSRVDAAQAELLSSR